MSDLLRKKSNSLICSFFMSDLSKLLTVAHLSWATWAIDSQLLFWHERPERFAHSCSFVLSDLSESLTVAHLIWAMSKWVNSQLGGQAKLVHERKKSATLQVVRNCFRTISLTVTQNCTNIFFKTFSSLCKGDCLLWVLKAKN